MEVHIWCDGSCRGNPGPMGIGVVLEGGLFYKEISSPIGMGTNQQAELCACIAGLAALKSNKHEVIVHTDSQYVIGLMTLNWKPKANFGLIDQLKDLVKKYNARFVKEPGHTGVPLQERANRLAQQASGVSA